MKEDDPVVARAIFKVLSQKNPHILIDMWKVRELNLKNEFWFEKLIIMFQKEVADRIIAKSNTSQYGRLTILSNWKLNVKKICDVSPDAFFPKPKIDSSVLIFSPKSNYFDNFVTKKSSL